MSEAGRVAGREHETLAAFPDEPVPPGRLAVEEGRRAAKASALASWPGD